MTRMSRSWTLQATGGPRTITDGGFRPPPSTPTPLSTWSRWVSASTKHPDAAVDLVKIATSDKWQETMSSTFSILTLNKNVDPKLIAKFKTEAPLKAEILELAGSKLDKITGYLKSPMEARVKDAFWTSVQPALLGEADPKEALASAEAKVNRILARQR